MHENEHDQDDHEPGDGEAARTESGHGHGHDHGGHQPRVVERIADVVVLGATAGGLAVACRLAESGRSVIVVDPAGPAELASARDGARARGVEVIAGRAAGPDAPASPGSVDRRVPLVGGHALVARVVVAGAPDGDTDGRTAGVAAPAPVAAVPSAADDEVAAMVEQVLNDLERPASVAPVDVADAAGLPGAVADPGEAGLNDPSVTATSTSGRDWDRRYADRPLWSGNPNGTLVDEVADLPPGRALDVGAGEGGDAIWLAERGWEVTANDISAAALDRLDAEATRRGLAVARSLADANAAGVFPTRSFDLVSAMYASIPRRLDGRGVANLVGAVAVGGTLLVVSHDLAPMRAPVDTTTTSRAFDPDAYVRVEDVAAAIAGDPAWEIEVHGTRPRPPGSATAHLHVDDLVLRARRVSTR